MIPIKDDIPSSTYPFVTVFLLALNIIVFLYQLTLGLPGAEAFILKMAAVPFEITNMVDVSPRSAVPPPFTLLTAMFVHGGLLHLAGNMLFLWIFGDNVEDMFGHVGFFIFYLATGVAASMVHIMLDPSSTTPMVGASGAIAGVLGSYFIFFPRAQIKTLVFLFVFVSVARVPAVVFLGLWFFFQILSSANVDGVAWFAHMGGFVAGAAVALALRPVLRRKR